MERNNWPFNVFITALSMLLILILYMTSNGIRCAVRFRDFDVREWSLLLSFPVSGVFLFLAMLRSFQNKSWFMSVRFRRVLILVGRLILAAFFTSGAVGDCIKFAMHCINGLSADWEQQMGWTHVLGTDVIGVCLNVLFARLACPGFLLGRPRVFSEAVGQCPEVLSEKPCG